MGWRQGVSKAIPESAKPSLRALRRAAIRVSAPVRRLRPEPVFPPVPAASRRLLIAPANFAGQGWAWARAGEAQLGDLTAVAMAVEGGGFGFPADYHVPKRMYRHPYWQRSQERYVLGSFTHVLVEASRPIFGPRHGDDCRGDLAVLRRNGLATALVAHGSDVRVPSRHAEREPDSPFRAGGELTAKLQRQAERFATIIDQFDGTVFVSTPDLLLDAPRAVWLPVVVDPQRWRSENPVLTRARPVVVHVPSNPWLKGSDVVDAELTRLAERGVVDYRRVSGIASAEMPAVLAEADIVVDQLRMGLYGVAACEAMAAGRTVVSYVGVHVRTHVRRSTGVEVPIVEADTATFARVVESLLDDRDRARAHAAAGPAFVRAVHDGRASAAALNGFLSTAASPGAPAPRSRR